MKKMSVRIGLIKCMVCLISAILVLFSASCTQNNDDREDLKIYAWVYDANDNPVFEEMRLNGVKKIYPQSELEMVGINITFEYHGAVKVNTNKGDIQLRWGNINEDRHLVIYDDMSIHGYEYLFYNKGIVSANINMADELYTEGYLGKEHFIYITCYSSGDENAPLISAALKLTQLDDKKIPEEAYSIELISCEYCE